MGEQLEPERRNSDLQPASFYVARVMARLLSADNDGPENRDVLKDDYPGETQTYTETEQ